MKRKALNTRRGLYDPTATRASCGVGVVVDLTGAKSHQLVEEGFRILQNLDHRGARGAEEKTGDGAGMLIQKPHEFFKAEIPALRSFDTYGVGQTFFPQDKRKHKILEELIYDCASKYRFKIIGWRDVPTDNSDLGKTALDSEPVVKQFFVEPIDHVEPNKLDAKLYILRRTIENTASKRELGDEHLFYICSLDRRKIVYKGLLTCGQLKNYYPDLSNDKVKTSLVLVHFRFSTNTLGSWDLAHPYRNIVHNGEINTLRGNKNWMTTREIDLACEKFGDDIDEIKPVTSEGLSDTAVLDNVLELLLEAGRELPHALRMLIPEAWNKDQFMDRKKRAFYDYFSTIIEPWDGPALVAATDGYRVAAVLDRNGLRPCRYCVTKDNKLIMGSETGILETPPSEIVFKGRLKPGQMFLADTLQRRIVPEDEIFAVLTSAPYEEWLRTNRVKLKDIVAEFAGERPLQDATVQITQYQRAFGYTLEYLRCLLQPMAEQAKDPLGSMGNDAALAVLSARNRLLFDYFSQLFAQVSNPPIDYLREDLVTSLEGHIGRQRNLLAETPEHCRQIFLESPILTDLGMDAIKRMDKNGIRSYVVDLTYPVGTRLGTAIDKVRYEAAQAINDGFEILVLSDRQIGPDRIPIPSLLAVGAVHHYLIRKKLRTRCGLVIETGQACTVHHFCTLIGYGAGAIYPWLAYESIAQMVAEGSIRPPLEAALNKYRQAIEGGILKVMSKMGISTLDSYAGAQVFETVGLKYDFVKEYFEGTTAHIPGVGLKQIEREAHQMHEIAFSENIIGNLSLDPGGQLFWRRDGELHQWNPLTIEKLQHAAKTGNYDVYKEFAQYINDQEERLQTLRGLLDFKITPSESIPIEEVEPREEIVKRFSTGSMSFGALSKEAHETLAIAMNRIGGKSGTGEGGEQVDRFGTERECTMKQVASGRFGVTINYLAHAKQIEIKMAQGSKPGEGGELPGSKVDKGIASVRFTTPGVGLISPPPHHDIYSIEDLAQLIQDLKCSNPEAEIHVKLVALGGIGTIAAGVAKARADAVLISGESGGTGASLLTSIKSAGSPWELGLAETHQVLLANNLRSRIKVRTDGGLKTGRDVVIAALLGAEEYGFGTAPVVTIGCIMLRKCHCNTCSVGIATHNPELRKRFPGKPEYVINYMYFMAQEVRELMATLGFRTVDEMIGRVDKLCQKNVKHPKGVKVDLSQLLYMQPSKDAPRKTKEQNHHLDRKIDHLIIESARSAIEKREPVTLRLALTNRDRTVGAMLSYVVAKKYGADALPPDTIKVYCTGYGGQSFGAFLAKGISLHLDGDTNDYVGKSLSGGKISVRKPADASFPAADNIIVGNVALYGATGGEAYFNGIAGERFAVRNSGAMAVVEGVGDHACEYMTSGVVVIIGKTGKNFGAGMSGGEAFIFDDDGTFTDMLNQDMVHTEDFTNERDHQMVRRLLENHYIYTQSAKAKEILDNWKNNMKKFIKVIPDAYAEVIARSIQQGEDVRLAPPPKPQESEAA
ncbi:MAG: glutamate synthase large subunit [Gammaproteobacteria bacterium]|nr:glutamate synthase large subunit [Gammaproteobacteria bacterium]MCI0591555.1 glutamate synthase large subunit [Gammaproteobacteria bacterium]